MARYIRNYEVIRELGAGHFGTVYLATGEVPARGRIPGKRRLVAIKKLKNTADRESVELLLQEFSLLEQVKHRCIVRVFEYLEEENAVVMEYIHGVTLRTVLEELDKAHEQVFTEAAVEIGCEIADALYQAYTTPSDNGDPLQLVHRDLKPANIMLTPNGEVKILDFGLARVDNADFARDNSDRIRGTPIYMAPEQARGEVVDHRSDLFGLGLIMFELLMGAAAYRVPADAADPLRAIFRAIEAGNLQEPCSRLETKLPGHGPVITRMLRPRPDDRYRNGHEVMVDLRRQLYRDRGAYLQEFCEFFFGSIHDIGEPPTLESYAHTPRARQGAQKSIAERLRESMARDKQASRRVSPAPTPVTPVVSSPPRAPMASNPSDRGRRPPPPPAANRASRAQTFTPGGSAPPQRRVRSVGERSPDETGMLQMVPLSDNPDEGVNNADPSATAFFAIPAPKSNRAAPTSTPAAPPQPAAFGGGGAPPPPVFGGGGGAGAPPPPAPFGGGGAPPPPRAAYGQGIGVGAAGGGAIAQGPIAQPGGGGGVAPPPNTPFGATGPTPDSQANREQSRTRSYQVFAILFAVFFMVCITGVGALWVIMSQQDKEPVANDPDPIAINTPNPTPPPPPEDTGEPIVEVKPPKPDPGPRPNPVRPPPQPSQPKEPAVAGAIVVKVSSGPVSVTEIRADCPGGPGGRAKVNGGSATVSVQGSGCTLRFKGPAINAKYVVSGSPSSLSCTITGTVVSCR